MWLVDHPPAGPTQSKGPYKVIINFCFKPLRFGVVCYAAINKRNRDDIHQPPHFPDRKIKIWNRGGLAKVSEQGGD